MSEYTAKGGTRFWRGDESPNVIATVREEGEPLSLIIPFTDLIEFVRSVEGPEKRDYGEEDRAAAWLETYQHCRSLGMDNTLSGKSGVQDVKDFISHLAAPPLSRRTEVLAQMAATIYAVDFPIKDAAEIARQLLAAIESQGETK